MPEPFFIRRNALRNNIYHFRKNCGVTCSGTSNTVTITKLNGDKEKVPSYYHGSCKTMLYIEEIKVTCIIQSTPGISSPRAATSVHKRMPLERDVNVDNAFSLAAYCQTGNVNQLQNDKK